ncbi:fluoride efflux transporter FluC [Frigoribacterium sp. NPDC087798]|uniref:fluoride efflux transporter FluC n=1 Tax=Frigoribacterium sp. NPDC087798 TaxID=3363993 RepID=UPI00381BAD01
MTGAARPRAPHLRPSLIALVALGGALGTAARVGITLVVPSWGAFDTAIFAINVVGAFVLGVLLERLLRSGPDEGGRRRLRLLVGTGVLGGFTTYSSLATETAALAGAGGGDLVVAVLYGLLSLVLGVLAAAAGIRVGARLAGRAS